MAYTCSMDCSVRVKKSGVSGYLHHMFRELYEESNHSNKSINNALTEDNVSLVYDDEIGDHVPVKSKSHLKEKMFSDLRAYEEQHGTLRKDAVWIRPIVMQLGNGFYDEFPDGISDDDDEHNAEISYMYEWACNTWGKENIRAVSVHMDETHPHVTFLMSAVREDDDGNLTMNQKSIINGKNHLRSLHKSYRSFMKDKGLDVELQTQDTSRPHYKDEEYKKIQDRKKRQNNNKKWIDKEKANIDKAVKKISEITGKDYKDTKDYDTAFNDLIAYCDNMKDIAIHQKQDAEFLQKATKWYKEHSNNDMAKERHEKYETASTKVADRIMNDWGDTLDIPTVSQEEEDEDDGMGL